MDKRIFWPFSTKLVTEWPGTRPAPWADHVGTDFAVSQGTPLRATISGTVYLTWNDGYGAYVLDIVRPDGFVVRNGHLSYMAVANGSWVNAGDYLGNTGGAAGTPGAGLSTGPHLHWELRWNRNWVGPGWVDPRDLTIQSFEPIKPAPVPPLIAIEEEEMIFIWKRSGNAIRWALVMGANVTLATNQKDADQLAIASGLKAKQVSAYAFNALVAGRKSTTIKTPVK